MELCDFPFFQTLDREQVDGFATACSRQQHAAGTELITRGEHGDKVYFLLEGEVEVYLPTSTGRRVLTTITPPAVFGEMEFLTGDPRTASVRALSDVTLLGITFDCLRARIGEGDLGALPLFVRMSEVLAQRLKQTDDLLAELEATAPRARRRELQDFRAKLMTEWSF